MKTSRIIDRRRRNFFLLLLVFFHLHLFPLPQASAHEFTGYVLGEARLFANSAIHEGQVDQSGSLAFQPEYYHEWEGGSSFLFVPFYRLDSADRERTHFDIRELTFLWLQNDFELRLGVRKVFWGSTEVLHLVDIINQTDLVENVDTEDKLGQPMVNLSVDRDWGTVDLFLLPFFRERTFPGKKGRLRGPEVVDTDRARFESSAQEWHTDWAIRYFNTIGDLDVGIHHFMGTGREPTLEKSTDGSGNTIQIPIYDQINQTGLDLTYVVEEWLWKMESIYRTGQGNENYFAWTGGFEYTFTGIFETRMDLGIIMEGMWDERGSEATTGFESDVVFGLRLAVNDAPGTEALFGWVQNVGSDARFLFLEARRRFGESWTLEVELRTFLNQPDDDFLFAQRADDLMQMELAYHF